HCTVQDDRTHSDQCTLPHRAAVHYGAMPHAHSTADEARRACVGVNHRQVLDVARVADHDAIGITANHDVVPDGGAFADRDIEQHGGVGCDERGRCNDGRLVRHAHLTVSPRLRSTVVPPDSSVSRSAYWPGSRPPSARSRLKTVIGAPTMNRSVISSARASLPSSRAMPPRRRVTARRIVASRPGARPYASAYTAIVSLEE